LPPNSKKKRKLTVLGGRVAAKRKGTVVLEKRGNEAEGRERNKKQTSQTAIPDNRKKKGDSQGRVGIPQRKKRVGGT